MITLDELAINYGTDKASHTYTKFYEKLLAPLRHEPIVFVEAGVAGGESIIMWDRYFTHPDTRIYGVDIHDRGVKERWDFSPRVNLLIGDATNPNFLFDLVNLSGPVDVFVDDADHYSKHQKDTLRLMWPNIKSGGLMILEDLHTSWMYPHTIPDEVSFVHHLQEWIDDLMEKGDGETGKPLKSDIDEITFRKSLVVLKKR